MPATTLADMSPEEFRLLLEDTIERKLCELLSLDESDQPLDEALHARLLRQREGVAAGARGLSLDDVRAALEDG